MAASSFPHQWKYDVFVSFRGEDIRKNFMDHMFNDFKQKGIYAFRDDNDLPKGEEISPQLYKAIEESRFLMVIFSKNYASSSWCLRELVKILECKKIESLKHEVRIIFYDAKPDVVRKQKRSYAKAFTKHDILNTTEVDKWKEALSMAANLSGWDLHDMTNGYEHKFIHCISNDILKILCDGPLYLGENLVGIDFHFDKLNLSRFIWSHKVNMIGICGMSGIGKTTLAKAIYNSMHTHFDASCFCDDVQEVEKRQGLTQVQKQMIGKILKTEDLQISSVGEGTMVIKQRMARKPILLVLDNVNSLEQLEALAGSPDWFFPGSLIIFTGKDQQLLRSHKVDGIYDMETLDYYKALELFSLNAFGKRHPTEDFEEFASQIVKYLHGHPLALKVFGRLLYDKSVHVWKSELDRLHTYPNSEIIQKLRPSFDSLASDQRRMFLDIACAFIGENKDFVASVLDGSHCSANALIEVLVDKCLVTVFADRLQMHELIQSMAREIIREEFRQNRRLWISSDDYEVLNLNTVTEEVEVLVLLLKKNSQNIPIDGQALTRMKNLRILKICFLNIEGHWQPIAVNFSGRLDFLSNKLRLLYWHGLPLKFLPSNFYPENIVTIDLSYSHINHFWTTPKLFSSLKFMKLRYCRFLTSTPDFTDIPNLEELILEGCKNLVKVHPSIGMLKKLLVLNMRDCTCLKSFPSNLEMDSLQILILSGCLKLDKLSEDLGRIKSLTELHIDRTSITELPLFGQQVSIRSRWWTSITAPFGLLSKQQHLQRSVSLTGFHMLKSLNFSYCNLLQVPERMEGLSCLEYLNLEGNNLLEVPESIGCLSFLEYLNLKGNNFTSLPGSLSQLSHLRDLCVDGCKRLEVLPELPPSLYSVRASYCTSLCSITGSSKDPFTLNKSSYLINCPKLFMNLAIDSQLLISETQCLNSSVTSQASTNRFSSFLRYAGTPGYCDPAYFETGILSKECDVYSFGVVLFEVLCGRLCCMYDKDKFIGILVQNWRNCYTGNRLDDIIFPDLKEQINQESLSTFAAIANRCLDRVHKRRPHMVEIVKELEAAINQQNSSQSTPYVPGKMPVSYNPMEEFQHLKIHLEDIKLATNNFDERKVIGMGGFGKTYKGEVSLPGGRRIAGFKCLDRKYGKGAPEFLSGITVLSKYKHENLVSLLGFCDEGDEMILIYEYAYNASLDCHLHSFNLTWTQRIKICIGITRALKYLHDPVKTRQSVIQRDIKSANILLDENFAAKVTDFSLSIVVSNDTIQIGDVNKVVGTPGYCDPLYLEKGIISKTIDVYSF